MPKRIMFRPDYVTRYCKRHDLDDYTDDELKCLWDIYLTYKQRGGRLCWTRFAMIPLTHKNGDTLCDTGMWTKYICEHLAEQGREMLNM